MIYGERKITVSADTILSQISQWDIYRLYLGDITLGEPFCNPLRQESNPSMVVREHLGKFRHMDYGDSFYKGGCFDLVEQKYYCDYNNALKWVMKDFGLSENGGNSGNRIITWSQPHISMKRPPSIHVVTRKHNKEELDWWARLLQGETELKRENVYSPKGIYRNYKKVPIPKGDLVICYYYPTLDKWKLYRPNKPKSRTKDTPVHEWKWDTNLDTGVSENLDAVRGAESALLTAKKKDRMYMMSLLQTDKICNVQAEDPVFLSEEVLSVFQEIPTKWANGDDDEKGRLFTNWLSPKGFGPVLGDFPDMGVALGHEAVLNHFKQIGWKS